MQVELVVGPDGLAATKGVSDDLRPHNLTMSVGHRLQLGEEGAELREE